MASFSIRIDDFGLVPGGAAVYVTSGVGNLPVAASGEAKIFPSKAAVVQFASELNVQAMETIALRMLLRAYQLKTGDTNFNSAGNLLGKTFTVDLSAATMTSYG